MDGINLNRTILEKLSNTKYNIIMSKKYCLLYLLLIILASLSMFTMKNYLNPVMGIFTFITVSLLGIFCISYYYKNNDSKNIFKVVFIVVLTFGIVCSFLTPICYVSDEVEHFVRSEMTSRGELIPVYEEGSYTTIQSTLDLIEDSKETRDTGFDHISGKKATIFKTDADTQPINLTPAKYPSAFAENPFYGYLPQAIGMFIAKLFDLNSIWLLWLGRIFNTLLYASLVAIAVKKTPILKIPLFIVALMPLSIYQIASVSIDSMINGLGILMIAYFFYMYKSPDNSLSIKHIITFALIGLLFGLCKTTNFVFIFLILFIPKQNFKGKLYYYNFIMIGVIGLIALLWARYAHPILINSFRGPYNIINNINSTSQLNFIIQHPIDFIISVLQIPTTYIESDLLFNSRGLWFNPFNSLYLMFIGSVILFYPKEKFNPFSRLGALLVSIMLYYGTYISFLFIWTPVGQLNPISGVQHRYFIPLFALFPFIFGINNNTNNNTHEIDFYLITIAIAFLASMLIASVVAIY